MKSIDVLASEISYLCSAQQSKLKSQDSLRLSATYLHVVCEDNFLEVWKHRCVYAEGVAIQVVQFAIVD